MAHHAHAEDGQPDKDRDAGQRRQGDQDREDLVSCPKDRLSNLW